MFVDIFYNKNYIEILITIEVRIFFSKDIFDIALILSLIDAAVSKFSFSLSMCINLTSSCLIDLFFPFKNLLLVSPSPNIDIDQFDLCMEHYIF